MMRGIASPLEKHHRVRDPGRGDRGRGAAVAPLHSGAAVARQVGQPARHRRGARRGQPARGAARGGRLPPAHPGAGDRAGDHRPRNRDRHRCGGARGVRADGELAAEQERLAGLEERLGRREDDWSTRCWRCAPRCARALLRSMPRRPTPRRSRPHRPRVPHRPARCRSPTVARCWPNCRSLQAELAAHQGEVAADSAERRRAGGGRGGRRLDRHPGRPDGEERGRRRC